MTSEKLQTPCQLWEGKLDSHGYPQISHHRNGDQEEYTKRGMQVIWWTLYGQYPPQGLMVRHLCGKRACVNKEHLVLGTQAQNSQDKKRENLVKWLPLWEARRAGKSVEDLAKDFQLTTTAVYYRLRQVLAHLSSP